MWQGTPLDPKTQSVWSYDLVNVEIPIAPLLTYLTYSCIACCLRSEPIYQPLSLLHLQNPTLALSLPPSTHRSPILGDFCKAPRIAEISGWIFGSVFESVKFAETSAATRYFWRAGSGSKLSSRVILHVNIPLGNSRINTYIIPLNK